MHCHRCQNLMFPLDLLDEGGGLASSVTPAWRCFACGDIIDSVIWANRSRTGEQLKRSPRFSVIVGAGR